MARSQAKQGRPTTSNADAASGHARQHPHGQQGDFADIPPLSHDPGPALPWQSSQQAHDYQNQGVAQHAYPQSQPGYGYDPAYYVQQMPLEPQFSPQPPAYAPQQPGQPQGYLQGHYQAPGQYPFESQPPPAGFYGQPLADPSPAPYQGHYAAPPNSAAAHGGAVPGTHPGQVPQSPHYQGFPDPAAYDLANYTTATPQQSAAYPQAAVQSPFPPQYPPSTAHPRYAVDPGAMGHHPGHTVHPAQQHPPHPQHQGHPHPAHPYGDEHHDEYEEHEDYEEDEPRSRARSMLVIGSLIGAIALGAGLAYGYKTLMPASKPPLVKADNNNTKAAAARGDGKISERLNAGVPPVVAATRPDDTPSGGARRVQTISVLPDGTVAGSSPPAERGEAASGPPLRPTISVPGMMVDNLPAPRPPTAETAAMPAPAPVRVQPPPAVPPPPAQVVTPVQPRTIARVEPQPAAPPASRPQPATALGAVTTAPKAVAQQAAPTAATPARTGANGYVAVLSSQGSRMDALRVYADLQQKYSSVLANRPADVQEATVNGKLWYRAVVGPPGSRQAASRICAELKSAGHNACFPAAY